MLAQHFSHNTGPVAVLLFGHSRFLHQYQLKRQYLQFGNIIPEMSWCEILIIIFKIMQSIYFDYMKMNYTNFLKSHYAYLAKEVF